MNKHIKTFLTVISSLLLLSGCGINDGAIKKELDKVIYMRSKDGNEMYALDGRSKTNGEFKINKLEYNATDIAYNRQNNKHFIIDKENNLYAKNVDGETELVNKHVIPMANTLKDTTILYYLRNDGELYEKKDDNGAGKKIAENISAYNYIKKNDIYYLTKDFSLYIKKEGQEPMKIDSKVKDFQFNRDGSKVLYNKEKALYVYDIQDNENEKLNDNVECILKREFIKNDELLYIVNSTSDEKVDCGTLYYWRSGRESKKICNEVKDLLAIPNEDGLFYLNSNGEVYFRSIRNKNEKKIYDNVSEIVNGNEEFLYLEEKKDDITNLIYINSVGQKEDIIMNVKKYFPYGNGVIALTVNNDLYLNNKKLEENVNDFGINGEEVIYVTSDNKMHRTNGKSESEVIIKDVNQYKDIYYGKDKIYSSKLS